jgi:hypothetical protein
MALPWESAEASRERDAEMEMQRVKLKVVEMQ